MTFFILYLEMTKSRPQSIAYHTIIREGWGARVEVLPLVLFKSLLHATE